MTATGDRWTLLIVLALSHERLRLSTLRARLPGVSSGVLDHHLSQMTALGLLSRQRYREMPPRVEVALTPAGSELLPIAAALARWGMRYEWPPPPRNEYVQADAVLRQLPALLEEQDDLPNGTIEAIVGAGEERTVHWFEIVDGRLRAAMQQVDATTKIEGDDKAWIAALGPARDHSRLLLGGRRQLAERILDSLPRNRRPADDDSWASDDAEFEDDALGEAAFNGDGTRDGGVPRKGTLPRKKAKSRARATRNRG